MHVQTFGVLKVSVNKCGRKNLLYITKWDKNENNNKRIKKNGTSAVT